MIKYLLLDLDNTILDFEKCEIDALKKTFTTYGMPFNKDVLNMYMTINSELWKKHEIGILTQEEVLVKRFDILFNKIGVSESSQAVNAKYQEFLSETAFFEEGALDVIQTLYQKVELYIVSNGKTNTQKSRIKKAGLDKYFSGVFISEELAFHKPQKEFFEKCFLQINNFCIDDALIVGDSISSDILGGKNAGMRTCWYNPKNEENYLKVKFDYEISRMDQILNIIEK